MSQPIPEADPRFEFTDFPWVFSLQLNEPSQKDRPLRLEAKNISRSGLKFNSNRKIPLLEQLQINLFEKGNGKEVTTLFAKVVRVEEIDTGYGEKTYGIAVEFLAGNETLDRLMPPTSKAGENAET